MGVKAGLRIAYSDQKAIFCIIQNKTTSLNGAPFMVESVSGGGPRKLKM